MDSGPPRSRPHRTRCHDNGALSPCMAQLRPAVPTHRGSPTVGRGAGLALVHGLEPCADVGKGELQVPVDAHGTRVLPSVRHRWMVTTGTPTYSASVSMLRSGSRPSGVGRL